VNPLTNHRIKINQVKKIDRSNIKMSNLILMELRVNMKKHLM